jgi:deoxyribose-phosphate aldolase
VFNVLFIKINQEEMSMLTKKQFCQMQDHALLRPCCKREDIKKWCEEVIKYDFASICIIPSEVAYCRKIFGDRPGVGTVIGYPQGTNTTKTKIFESLDAIDNGADELDVVINITKFKEGDYDYVRNELTEIVKAVKAKDPKVLVKVIFERTYLTTEEIPIIAKIIMESGADYIKEATGYSPVGKTPDEGCGVDDIRLIKSVVGDKIKIKSAGGTNNLDDCVEVIKAGASRVGHVYIPGWLDAAGDDYWKDK